jgi:hypothetical protein
MTTMIAEVAGVIAASIASAASARCGIAVDEHRLAPTCNTGQIVVDQVSVGR